MSAVDVNIKERIWELLETVPDPEIPVINVVELGVVRKLEISDDEVTVVITPTYTGCPAMNTFEADIIETLNKNGFENVKIKTIYAPAWTTDWLNEETKQKLKKYGIAPPGKVSKDEVALFSENEKSVICPYCESDHTRLTSRFGSTACKALHYCDACQQPFEEFKCH